LPSRNLFSSLHTYDLTERVFVHSAESSKLVQETFAVPKEKIVSIPFGDHAAALATPPEKDEARARLGIKAESKMVLFFGSISPYRGALETIEAWRKEDPLLYVIGPCYDPDYLSQLRAIAVNKKNVFVKEGLVTDSEIPIWFSACDAALFYYQKILSSGAACLARSLGVPLLIPKHCASVDLHEPHPGVERFDKIGSPVFWQALARSMKTPADYHAAAPWRKACSWDKVAAITARTYREVISK